MNLLIFLLSLRRFKTKYCLDNGRKAIPSIRMFKYLLLKAIHDLSWWNDQNMTCPLKCFLGVVPEDEVIDPSSLTKFRRLRLKDALDMLIGKKVEIALEKKLITSKTAIVDATYTKARYNQKSPREFL